MSTTRNGWPGNGFVCRSFASTSMLVEVPRCTTARSGPGCTSGRVEATTSTLMRPDRPWFVESATATPIVERSPGEAESATLTVSRRPDTVAVVPLPGRSRTDQRSSGRSDGYG
jgi:hypothetical protein